MKKPIVRIDLDDTTCMYKEHYLYCKEVFYNIQYPQSREGFFLELEPIDGAIEYIELLKEDFDIWFLTRPSFLNPHSYTEKRLWVEKYFGLDMCKKLDFVNDKSAMSGDYLIDDVKWDGFKGVQLQFGTEGLETWEKVYIKLKEYINHRTYHAFKPYYLFNYKKYLVIFKYYDRGNYIPQLEADLKKDNYVGEVYFDNLMCNGFNSNRFTITYFDGEKLDLNIQKHYANNMMQDSGVAYFQDHPELIDGANILTYQEKERLRSLFSSRRKIGSLI